MHFRFLGVQVAALGYVLGGVGEVAQTGEDRFVLHFANVFLLFKGLA